MPVWKKLSAVPCLRYEGDNSDPPSYMLTMDHGLHQLGLCRACSKLDWQAAASEAGYVLRKNHWEILNTQRQCRFCAFISQTFRGLSQSSLRHLIVARDIAPNQKLSILLNLRDGNVDVSLDGTWRPVLAKFELYCEPGMSHKFSAELH